MSKTGLAHRPGTAVLPTCSSVSCSSEAAARMRDASARKREGQRSSYSTSRTVPDSRPSESLFGRGGGLLRKGGRVKVDPERGNLRVAYGKDLGDVALKQACRALELIARQRAGVRAVHDHRAQLERLNHRVEALRRFDVGLLAGNLLDRAGEAGEGDI